MLARSAQLLPLLLATSSWFGCSVHDDAASQGDPADKVAPDDATGGAGSGGVRVAIPAQVGSGGSVGPEPEGYVGCIPKQLTPENYASAGGAGGAGGADPGSLQVGDGDLSVLVVFDRSGSMQASWGDKTRYWAAHDALMRGVHHYIQNLSLAAIRFPVGTACGVTGLDQGHQIPWLQGYAFVDRWNDEVCDFLPGGSTPLTAALDKADQTIDQAKSLGLLKDRFRVLVLTDGEETCDPIGNPVDYAKKWAAVGIETHVIGLPGSENAASILRAMAEAGGGVYTAVPATGDPEAAQGVLIGAVDPVLR